MQYAFPTRQVIELTGIGGPVLADLKARGIVRASVYSGSGKGNASLFDFFDLVGISTVQFLRPKAETSTVLKAAFDFWHSDEGRGLVDTIASAGSAGAPIQGLVVIDRSGRIGFEQAASMVDIARKRKSAMLIVIEPNELLGELAHDVALKRMTGEHAAPNLPTRRPPRKTTQVSATEKRRLKKLALPQLLREEAALTEPVSGEQRVARRSTGRKRWDPR